MEVAASARHERVKLEAVEDAAAVLARGLWRRNVGRVMRVIVLSVLRSRRGCGQGGVQPPGQAPSAQRVRLQERRHNHRRRVRWLCTRQHRRATAILNEVPGKFEEPD